MDPVDPHVDVVGLGQGPLAERLGLVLPLADQPGDRGWGQAGPAAQELLQRGGEVRGGQPVQVQQRQHLGQLRGLACPRGQDRRGEPPALTRGLIDPPVVDPGLAHRDRTRSGAHLSRLVVTVAHHQAVAVLVDLVSVCLDVGGDLGLQRRREHLPSPITDDLIQQRPAPRSRVDVGLDVLLDCLEHGRTFPSRRANTDTDQNLYGLQILLGRYATLTSPRRGPSTGSDHCSVECSCGRWGILTGWSVRLR